jgi:hypothetical protein
VSDWENIEIEPTHRKRVLPDGREMRESRLTIPKEWMEQMWQGYRCASCLEEFGPHGLGSFPVECPICCFPVKALQRRQLEQDFVGEVEQMRAEGFIDKEMGRLEREFFVPKPQIHVRRDL